VDQGTLFELILVCTCRLPLTGSLVVKSVGPVTKKLLVGIPEPARWKSLLFCPCTRQLTPNHNNCSPGARCRLRQPPTPRIQRGWVKCGRHISVECIHLCNWLDNPFPTHRKSLTPAHLQGGSVSDLEFNLGNG
jgi:hypothetical protein